ncbi:MAG: hypothetical protein J2P17_30405 [Mycobacterium sp.]|nr:hypothetical protein [Mycobacterium sp.]
MANGTAETWLVSLAQDILDHEACFGCKYNAATALEQLGVLDEVLVRLGRSDPREKLRGVAATTNTTAYRSSLVLTLDDGTVLRDEAAHEWMRRLQDDEP